MGALRTGCGRQDTQPTREEVPVSLGLAMRLTTLYEGVCRDGSAPLGTIGSVYSVRWSSTVCSRAFRYRCTMVWYLPTSLNASRPERPHLANLFFSATVVK